MNASTAFLLAFFVASIASAEAQVPPVPAGGTGSEAAPSAAPAVADTDAREVREQFEALLKKYPPELGRILKMDPTMLSNQEYLAQYPAVQGFLAQRPEISRNPSFYLDFVRLSYDDYTRPTDARERALNIWSDAVEAFGVFVIMAFIAGMIAWLVKTTLDHRRWLRMSKVQTEVHNKLLDRFAGTNELLAYVQSPAGRRFLEAAPIPVEAAGDRPISAPISRILWSVQAGIVLLMAGLGFQYVSRRVIEEVAQGMWTVGVLFAALGLGFIAAGAFSFVMSRRLGLLEPPSVQGAERGDSPAI